MGKFIFKESDLEAFLEGLRILGTGGGGSPKLGQAILENEFKMQRQIEIIDPDDIPDESCVVSGGIMGSVTILDRMDTGKLISGWEKRFELTEVMELMSGHIGKRIDYVVPFEMGGLNTPVIMSLAARMGIPVIDGDSLGRAAPETQMASFLSHGISLTPMPLVDTQGNSIIVTQQEKATFADEIGRWMITKGGGMGANGHYPMSGKDLKRSVIPRTITEAIELGKVLLSAKASNKDPVDAVIRAMRGVELFSGKVETLKGENKGGFYITTVRLKGAGQSSGKTAELVIKNETMALWVDGQIKTIFPDFICMMDAVQGNGILSTDIEEGKDLILAGRPCHERLRNGLKNPLMAEAFGGSRYGHPEVSFIPMEEL